MEKPIRKLRGRGQLGKAIHAKTIRGHFNTGRWAMVWLTQIIFYGACWLTWDAAGGTRQAILFDIAHEKLYLFGLVLWPQDALLLAFVLILAATGLFFVTALAGRLFCGFACPQTVYTAMFTWIEAQVEGDYLARQKLEQRPMNGDKWLRRVIKHSLWALLAGWTAISFVGYFTPIRELLPSLAQLDTGPWEAFWLIFYAAFTYVQAGLAREAVCQHMCPYARFQGVMFDPATRNVSYDLVRGEPRRHGPHRDTAGDCIDCGICVQVCPTGIDIRDGLQYQCINCGLCIDACNQVMDKTGKPRGLIRFASEHELASQAKTTVFWRRPRIMVYAALLVLFGGLAAWTLTHRSLLLVDVLRDRGALSRESSEGRIENSYTLKLMNLDETPQRYQIQVSGLPGIEIVGQTVFTVEPGSIQPVSMTVSVPAEGQVQGIHPMLFSIATTPNPATRIIEKSSFVLP